MLKGSTVKGWTVSYMTLFLTLNCVTCVYFYIILNAGYTQHSIYALPSWIYFLPSIPSKKVMQTKLIQSHLIQ